MEQPIGVLWGEREFQADVNKQWKNVIQSTFEYFVHTHRNSDVEASAEAAAKKILKIKANKGQRYKKQKATFSTKYIPASLKPPPDIYYTFQTNGSTFCDDVV